MATRVIDDSKLQNIAVAIQSKDNGGQMTVDEMPARIEAIPSGGGAVTDPALVLWDWEGTKLAEYSRQDALALTALPSPDTLPPYAGADHELLLFQSWNRSLTDIKAWLSEHEGETLNVGAIYTTTDGQDHNYWGNPRLTDATLINMHKRATTHIGSSLFSARYSLAKINLPAGVTSIGNQAFRNCQSLTQINIPYSVTSIGSQAFSNCSSLTQINLPDGVTSIDSNLFSSCNSLTKINIPARVTSIGDSAFSSCNSLTKINIPARVTSIGRNVFYNCSSLTQINLPDGVTSIGNYAFYNCITLCDILNESKAALSNTNAFGNLPSVYRIYVPRANLSWYETETNWSTIYTQGHIVAIEDYIEYLESLGYNVDKYKEA